METIKPLIDKAKQRLHLKPFDAGHEVNHHFCVWANCIEIVYLEKLNDSIDMNVLQVASWWHDVERGSETHDVMQKCLKELEVSDTFIKKVKNVINEHSFGRKQTTLESQILFDADKIEYVSIGRFEAVLMAAKTGEMSEELFSKYKKAWNERIPQIMSQLHFNSSKDKFEERYRKFIEYGIVRGIYKDNKWI